MRKALVLFLLLAGCAGPARSGWDRVRWDSPNDCDGWDREQRPECPPKEGGAK